MVCHQTVGMNAASVAFDTLLKQEEKLVTVFVVKEDVGSAVATEHNVVERARILDSWFTRHGMILGQVCSDCSAPSLSLNHPSPSSHKLIPAKTQKPCSHLTKKSLFSLALTAHPLISYLLNHQKPPCASTYHSWHNQC